MNDEKILSELKDKLDRLKREKAQKEGERNAVFASIQRDFGVETIDEAHKKLTEMSAEIGIKKEKRDELLKIAQERLANYQ